MSRTFVAAKHGNLLPHMHVFGYNNLMSNCDSIVTTMRQLLNSMQAVDGSGQLGLPEEGAHLASKTDRLAAHDPNILQTRHSATTLHIASARPVRMQCREPLNWRIDAAARHRKASWSLGQEQIKPL